MQVWKKNILSSAEVCSERSLVSGYKEDGASHSEYGLYVRVPFWVQKNVRSLFTTHGAIVIQDIGIIWKLHIP
jgi:hypothetical protein